MGASDEPRGPAGAVPRVALTVEEAATSLGISRDHFERHVMDDVRIIYCGRRRLVPIRELERWANRMAVAVPRRQRHDGWPT